MRLLLPATAPVPARGVQTGSVPAPVRDSPARVGVVPDPPCSGGFCGGRDGGPSSAHGFAFAPSSGAGGRSFADVVAFEAEIHDVASSGLHSSVIVSVLKPVRVPLDPDIVEEILHSADELSSRAAICHFRGFWPSLANLHSWISTHWEPLIEKSIHIFLVAKRFFVAKFDSANDRKSILCHNGFSWQGKFPLMAKLWHMDFDPLTKTFNKYPIWVQLPNLPLHIWHDSVFEAIGNAIGEFLYVDSDTSDILHSTCAQILVELDVSKGLPEVIYLDSSRGSKTQILDFEGIPFRCRKCHQNGHIATHCVAGKAKARRPPSWWLGVAKDHYTVRKSPDVTMAPLAEVSPDDEPVDEEDASSPVSSPSSDAPPGGLFLTVSSSETVLASASLGLLVPAAMDTDIVVSSLCDPPRRSASSRENVLASLSPGLHYSDSSEVWDAEATKVEDGWTAVKRKKSKPSVPHLDMNLRSRKDVVKEKS